MSKKADVSIGLLELIGMIIGLILLGFLFTTLFKSFGALNPTEARSTEVSFNNLALTINQLIQDPAPLSYAVLPFFLGEQRAIIGFDKNTITYFDCFFYVRKTVTKPTTQPPCNKNCICLTDTTLPDEERPTIFSCKTIDADSISVLTKNARLQPFSTARPFLANSIGETLTPILSSYYHKIYDARSSLLFYGSSCAIRAQTTRDFEKYARYKGYTGEINNAIASQKFGQTLLYIEKHELPTGEKIIVVDYGGDEQKIQERLRAIGEAAAEQHFDLVEQTTDLKQKIALLERLQTYPVLSAYIKEKLAYKLCETYHAQEEFAKAVLHCTQAADFGERDYAGGLQQVRQDQPLSKTSLRLGDALLATGAPVDAVNVYFDSLAKADILAEDPNYLTTAKKTITALNQLPLKIDLAKLSEEELFELADSYAKNIHLVEIEINRMHATITKGTPTFDEATIKKELRAYIDATLKLHYSYIAQYSQQAQHIRLNLALLTKDRTALEEYVHTANDDRLPVILLTLISIYEQSGETELIVITAERFLELAPSHPLREQVTKLLEQEKKKLAGKKENEKKIADELSKKIEQDEQYRQALDALNKKQYETAAAAFSNLFKEYPPEKHPTVITLAIAACAAADVYRQLPQPDNARCSSLAAHCLTYAPPPYNTNALITHLTCKAAS